MNDLIGSVTDNSSGKARYLSSFDVWALSLGCIIGWGAFVMPGTTFLPLAGPVGTLIAMAVSAVITLIIGVNYAWLMRRHPGIGGVYAYTKEAFGRDHAFLSSWFLCLSYMSLIPQNATAFAVMCRVLFSDAVQQGFHYQVAGYDVYLAEAVISIVTLVIFAVLAIRCKPLMQRLQTGFAVVLLAGIVIITVLAVPHIRINSLTGLFGIRSVGPARAVISIIALAPWAFVGFEVISLETAHFRFPVKKSLLLIVLAILVGGFIYVAMSFVACSVVPDGYASWQAYIGDLDRFTGYAALPTFFAARSMLGGAGLVIIGITAMAAVLSSVIGFYRASARILTNMADDHILSKRFSKPAFCLLFIMVISAAISLFGRNAVSWVVDLSSLGAIVGFGYTSLATYRTARAGGEKGFAAAGAAGVVLSVVFALVQLLPRLTAVETMETESYLLLSLWCLLGFAFYSRMMRSSSSLEKYSESITIGALFVMLLFSAMIWYVRRMIAASGVGTGTAVRCSAITFVLILLGLIVMLLILTQVKKRSLVLERERIRAVESSLTKSRFLFNMSHDLRTPMNAIIGYTKLALQSDTAPETRDYLEKIDASSGHLLDLINDILEMSRIESGAVELDPQPNDLRQILGDVHDLFDAQMREKSITFTTDAGQVRHPYVLCDRRNMNRILLNIVSNACKFTPEGGSVSVTLTETGGEEGAGRYELRIRDSGIGMSDEFAEKLFTAFERERTSTVSGIQGTGLGMSITKSLLDLMGASIEVNTAPGEGTEIVIHLDLPLAEPDVRPEQAAESTPAEPERTVDFSKKRLLLVEDNDINREIAVMILSQEGFALETAENGAAAVEKVAASAPGYYDAVLMDIQMPVMDGYEATRAIRALDDKALASVPIVAMTANAFREDELAAAEAGMQAHIAKPLDVQKMLATLTDVLTRAEADGN